MEFLLAKFSCDIESQFRGMTNYENMINYLSDLRRKSEKLEKPLKSVFGGHEDAEHDFVTRLNNRKVKKSAANKRLIGDIRLKEDVKYDSDSSVPSSFRTDR